jgi:hypothetical protein
LFLENEKTAGTCEAPQDGASDPCSRLDLEQFQISPDLWTNVLPVQNRREHLCVTKHCLRGKRYSSHLSFGLGAGHGIRANVEAINFRLFHTISNSGRQDAAAAGCQTQKKSPLSGPSPTL